MPSFYSHGGAMLTPETIENRRQARDGEEVVFTNKKALIDAVVDLKSAAGERTTSSQIIKYEAMRRDQLEELYGMYLKKQARTAKISVADEKEVKTKPVKS